VVKRIFDIAVSLISLIVIAPALLAISFWIKLDSPGPVLFRQERVGRGGRDFEILKFRSMIHRKVGGGSLITTSMDNRITASGRFLRRYKLDELPQLINVVRGEMSLVGPRPEVPKYVDCYPVTLRDKVLSVRPGITDAASIMFSNENDLIDEADDPERRYVEKILPVKLQIYSEYVDQRSFFGDLRLLLRTVVSIFRT
jgi:lipopolysaccharide/colanic/teichoic acid biosynthesis glycosyltransferase